MDVVVRKLIFDEKKHAEHCSFVTEIYYPSTGKKTSLWKLLNGFPPLTKAVSQIIIECYQPFITICVICLALQ